MSLPFFDAVARNRTPLFLAPQAGVSESPFRRLCRRFGADVVVSEFVSADALVRGNEKSLEYLRFREEERPIGVQIFGADPGRMGEAAALVEELRDPDFIDINFGCPVKKIVKREGGSACLRDRERLGTIIRAVDEATDRPTTVKIRSGFDEASRDPVGIARVCRDSGARLLTIHPRTREDMYSGRARWDEIRDVVEALEIPVIGNGDVRSGNDARRMHRGTGCAGIMIARGSHGAPWIFAQARAALRGDPVPPDPGVEERFGVVLEHARNAIDFKEGEERAMLEFRKHLGWYARGLPHGKTLRKELHQVRSLEEAEEILRRYLERALSPA